MIRAKVLSQEVVPGEYYDKRVYNLRILKTYKGAVGLNQTKDIRPHGSKQRSLFTKAYTSVGEKKCGIKLANDTVYLLTGTISGQKLRIGKCKWVQRWADVTPRQRMGIRRFYGDNCDCQISPCYAESCKKLQGCRKSGNFYDSDCEWRHSYCLVNADKSACAWHETEEYNKRHEWISYPLGIRHGSNLQKETSIRIWPFRQKMRTSMFYLWTKHISLTEKLDCTELFCLQSV